MGIVNMEVCDDTYSPSCTCKADDKPVDVK